MTRFENPAHYEIVWLVRRLFRALSETADHYLQDDGLTAADRAVMEFLYPDEKLSVPRIAGKYRVSRQHIQTTVNQLRSTGLLQAETNPQHKRSPLFSLSELGREAFAEIRRNEAAIIEKLFANLDQDDVSSTRATLAALYDRCESGELR